MRNLLPQSKISSTYERSPTILSRFNLWWLTTTNIYQHSPENTLESREQVRRSKLISWLILGLFVAAVILSPLAIGDLRARVTLLCFILGLVLVAIFNRSGHTIYAGIFLVVLISGTLLEANLASPIGLTMGELPNFDAYVVSVAIAAIVLPNWMTFVVAGINSLLISGNYLLQPHNANLQQDALLYSSTLEQTISLLVRPIALQLVLAVISYLWVRGTNQAIARAERAEEVAVLEHRELQRTFALEEGMHYLHQTLQAWVEGDFRHRVPQMPLPLLEQVRDDLNLFIERVVGISQATAYLQRLNDAIQKLASVLEARANGFILPWPGPSGTALDRTVQLLAHNAPSWPGSQFPGRPTSAPANPWSEAPRTPSSPSNPSWQSSAYSPFMPTRPSKPQLPNPPVPPYMPPTAPSSSPGDSDVFPRPYWGQDAPE